MAVYHFELQVISRGQGRSAVAAAAYRSGERLVDPWDGMEHDYTHKGGIVYKEILLPDHAPPAYRDRASLWSAVELSEKASDCRLARECIVALPKELPLAEQIKLVRDYVQENFVSLGMCADITVHFPVQTDDLHHPIDRDGNPTNDPSQFQYINPHAHILLTVRALDNKGRWEAKTQKEYLCKRGGAQQGMTAAEFAAAKEQGWEKQYQYQTEQGRTWLTPSEAGAQGLTNADRISRSPRSAPHGRENPTTADWNSKDRLLHWRDAWAEAVNRSLQERGISDRVDARSYAERGIDRIPSVRECAAVRKARKRAQRLAREGHPAAQCSTPEVAHINEQIRAYDQMAAGREAATKVANGKVLSTASRLERLRSGMISAGYQGAILTKGLEAMMRTTRQKEADAQEALSVVDLMLTLNAQAQDTITELMHLLDQTGSLQFQRRRKLQEQISETQKQAADRAAYVESTLRQRGFSNVGDARQAAQQAKEQSAALADRQAEASDLAAQGEAMSQEYASLLGTVPPSFQAELDSDRAHLRQMNPDTPEGVEMSIYRASVRAVDKALDPAPQKRQQQTKNKRR